MSSAVNSSSSSSSSSASGEGALKSRHDPGHGAADCANVDSRLGCFFTAAVPHASDPHKEAVKARGRVVAAGLGFLASAFPARPRRGGLFAVCPPPARPAGQRGASPSRLPQREQRFGPRRPERSAPHGDPLRKSHVAKGVSRLRPGPRWSMSPSRSQRPRHAAPVSRRPRPSPPGLPRRGAAADAPLSPPRALWTERRRRASPPRSRCARGVTWSGWERRGLASREQRSAGRTIAPAHSRRRFARPSTGGAAAKISKFETLVFLDGPPDERDAPWPPVRGPASHPTAARIAPAASAVRRSSSIRPPSASRGGRCGCG